MMKLRLLNALTCAVLVAGATASQPAPDRVTAVPSTKVLFENDCVRVQYHDVAVGETIPMHSHPAYVVYALKSFKARITLADGTQRISEHKAGEAYWNEPITHSVENLGSSDIHNLIVELKPRASCHAK
jgi:quercetin dioxygenase-like cupin family protein